MKIDNRYNYNLGLRFEEIVRKYGSRNALVYPSKKVVTYSELDQLANQIGCILRQRGVNSNATLLLSGDKSPEMFATILASLKHGITYCVYDPEGPAKRLERIINVCQPQLIITSDDDTYPVEKDLDLIDFIAYSEVVKQASSQVPIPPMETADVVGNQLAYIMFTSGSSGTPKGAMMTHANVLSLIDWSLSTFCFGPGEVLTNVNPSYFDNFVFDFYSALFSGASLVPFKREHVINPKILLDSIDALGCTSWFSVPTMLIYLQNMRALESSRMSKIRRIIFGGEGYPKAKLAELFKLFGTRIEFINVYGPTECTCICSSYQVTKSDFDSLEGFLPLGELIRNYGYYIMDADLRSVEVDNSGELCLWGPAVGQGYYNDHERTIKAFVQDPNSNVYTRMIYRTGDIVKYNSNDKKIYILGRKDNQIKHMGYRIELEEIENGIMKLAYIDQAFCAHKTIGGLSRLIAVIATKEEIQSVQIIQDLKQHLPQYMIPGQFHVLDSLPTNPNGKVDRVKLNAKYTGE